MFNVQLPLDKLELLPAERIQHVEADFLWKVSLKILNSVIIPKPFTRALWY